MDVRNVQANKYKVEEGGVTPLAPRRRGGQRGCTCTRETSPRKPRSRSQLRNNVGCCQVVNDLRALEHRHARVGVFYVGNLLVNAHQETVIPQIATGVEISFQ